MSDITGAGMLLTMLADVAPKTNSKGFMGAMRLVQDIGGVLGPILGGFILHLFDFRTACVCVSCIGFCAAAWCQVLVEETHEGHSKDVPSPPASPGTKPPTSSDLGVEAVRIYDKEESVCIDMGEEIPSAVEDEKKITIVMSAAVSPTTAANGVLPAS